METNINEMDLCIITMYDMCILYVYMICIMYYEITWPVWETLL